MNLIADLMGTVRGNVDLWGWEGTAGAALGEARRGKKRLRARGHGGF